MGYSNLISYTNLTGNCTKPRNHALDTLTPHVVVGQVTAKWIADYFTNPAVNASCNYGIGKDGDISLGVDENDRSWCTSSRENDHRAITVEIASDKTDPYTITDKAYAALIDLFTDICKRHGKTKVVWKPDKDYMLNYNPAPNEMRITVHRWFANKSCPGPYLYERLTDVANEINKRLDGNYVAPKEELCEGCKGSAVEQLQKDLIELGYDLGEWGADGSFGPKTKEAVIKFQKDNKLEDDGIVGPLTEQMIAKKLEEKHKAEAEAAAQKLYRVRISWEDVKSQKGAFTSLDNAKTCCDSAGIGYKVFDWNGNEVYAYIAPVVTPPAEEPKQEETIVKKAVYDLDYPEKHLIVETKVLFALDKEQCTKAIIAIKKNNPDFNVEIAKTFFTLAPKYRIDPMRAISQSILETGWFKFAGSSVKPEQNNYCGLGATGGGVAGAAFETVIDGVRAQLQHLYAYGCKDALPVGEETIIDPRFKYVTRGIATYWEQLAGRWACPGFDGNDAEVAMKAGNTYGQKIDNIYDRLQSTSITEEDIKTYFVETEDIVIPDPQPPVNPSDVKIDNNKVNIVLGLLAKILEALVKFFTGK